MELGMSTKVCSRCGAAKSRTEFHKKSESKDGLNSWCKACKKEYEKSEHNVQRKRLTTAEWRKREPAKVIAGVKRWRRNNPEKAKRLRAIAKSKRVREYTPKQRARRLAVAMHGSASNHKCVECGNQAEHWHHWSYEPQHWTSVIPMCYVCHVRLHSQRLGETASRLAHNQEVQGSIP